jgi:hypothetical protein
VIRQGIFEAKSAEPSISQIQMYFFAKPPFGSNPEAVADDQHANHQFGIDRGTANPAVERRQVAAQILEIQTVMHVAKQMIGRNMMIDVE